MKNNYSKPICTIVEITSDTQLLTISGGLIGGTTGHFDAPRRRRFGVLDGEEEEEETDY